MRHPGRHAGSPGLVAPPPPSSARRRCQASPTAQQQIKIFRWNGRWFYRPSPMTRGNGETVPRISAPHQARYGYMARSVSSRKNSQFLAA
jgi:hypothetical protein